MIGYLFSKSELNEGVLNKSTPSINALLLRTGENVEEILYGQASLGAMFERAGYRAVPSPRYETRVPLVNCYKLLFRQPAPGSDKYYRGGWITQVHGSRDGGNIDAIQLEFPTEIREEAGPERRREFAERLAHNIITFSELYYDLN